MPSLIAWLDASSEEQRRMRDIIRLFSQRESRDELGLGQIRDAIADSLFPGTSTLLTRARYLLFVPWAFQKAAGRPNAVATADRYERDTIRALRASEDYAGLLGMRVGEAGCRPVRAAARGADAVPLDAGAAAARGHGGDACQEGCGC